MAVGGTRVLVGGASVFVGGTGVGVKVGVGVFVGGTDVGVLVGGTAVCVGVLVGGCGVLVEVGVRVGVEVDVGSGVSVGRLVAVLVGCAVWVGTCVADSNGTAVEDLDTKVGADCGAAQAASRTHTTMPRVQCLITCASTMMPQGRNSYIFIIAAVATICNSGLEQAIAGSQNVPASPR